MVNFQWAPSLPPLWPVRGRLRACSHQTHSTSGDHWWPGSRPGSTAHIETVPWQLTMGSVHSGIIFCSTSSQHRTWSRLNVKMTPRILTISLFSPGPEWRGGVGGGQSLVRGWVRTSSKDCHAPRDTDIIISQFFTIFIEYLVVEHGKLSSNDEWKFLNDKEASKCKSEKV